MKNCFLCHKIVVIENIYGNIFEFSILFYRKGSNFAENKRRAESISKCKFTKFFCKRLHQE